MTLFWHKYDRRGSNQLLNLLVFSKLSSPLYVYVREIQRKHWNTARKVWTSGERKILHQSYQRRCMVKSSHPTHSSWQIQWSLSRHNARTNLTYKMAIATAVDT